MRTHLKGSDTMRILAPVTYRRLSHHEAAFRDCRDRAFGERLRHPFLGRRARKAGQQKC